MDVAWALDLKTVRCGSLVQTLQEATSWVRAREEALNAVSDG